MTDKERVLLIYPNATLFKTESSVSPKIYKYTILSYDTVLSISFRDEDAAWNWALTRINYQLMHNLST